MNRHADTFLTLRQIADRPILPYRPTYDWPDKFIDDQHRALANSRVYRNSVIVYDGVRGRLKQADAAKLYELAYFCGGDILEFGTMFGLSALVSLQASVAAGLDNRIVTVDSDQGKLELAKANLVHRPGAERLGFCHDRAAHAVGELAEQGRLFSLVFIDHSHNFSSLYWLCKYLHQVLKPNCFALFHDYNDLRNTNPERKDYAVFQGLWAGINKAYWEFWGVYGCAGLFRRVPHNLSVRSSGLWGLRSH